MFHLESTLRLYGSCGLGTYTLEMVRNEGLEIYEDLSEFSTYDPSVFFLRITTNDEVWKESEGTDEDKNGISGTIDIQGLVYPIEAHNENDPRDDVWIRYDGISGDYVGACEIFHDCNKKMIQNKYFSDACFEAYCETDQRRVVISMIYEKSEGYSAEIYPEVLNILSEVFGENQSVMIWLDNTENNADPDDNTQEIIDMLYPYGFDYYTETDKHNVRRHILLKPDQEIKRQLKRISKTKARAAQN